MATSESDDNARVLAKLLKVIADETRLRILGLLAERPYVGKDLATALGLSAPTVSHHMRKLVDAGIVTAASDAQMQRYELNSELLLEMRRKPVSESSGQDEQKTATSEEDAYRAKVLRTFFDGERLESIPVKRKPRVIVLQHLLRSFDPNRTYSEPEVNDILRRAFDDVATLRRELVDYGFMTRERGIYQVSRSTPGRSKQVAQEIVGDEHEWLASLIQLAVSRSQNAS